MDIINVKTYQNTNIRYRPAPVAHRICATLIDMAVLSLYFLFIILVYSSFDNFLSQHYYLIIILLSPYAFYHLFMEVVFEGRSIGKMLMKIGVMREDGSKANFLDYFIRWLFRLIDITISLGSIGLITIVLTGKGKRLGDLVAGTTVVHFGKKATQHDLSIFDVQDNHQVMFPGAENLTEKDVGLIRDALFKYGFENKQLRTIKLAKMMIEKAGAELNGQPPKAVLKQLLEDYNHLMYKT